MTQASRGYLWLLASVAALGGLLFGYDTAVISGAIGGLKGAFHLDGVGEGWAASCALLGCIIGAIAGGPLSDAMGRKKVLLICAAAFALSGLFSALPRTLGEFVLARLLGGMAIGAVSVVSPLYIAEVAPSRIRGTLVSLYQLAIVMGILLVFFVNLVIQRQGDEAWNIVVGWRYMMGSLALPAVLFGLLLLAIPESPRWLFSHGHTDRARTIITRLSGTVAAEIELREIQESLDQDKGHWRELFTAAFRRPLLVGAGLALFCQFSGINAIMYYAPEIFKATGAGRESAFMQTVIVGIVNLLFTFVAIGLVDRAGRRFLLLLGSALQVVALGGIALMYHLQIVGAGLLGCILLFIAAFAMAMGPVPWIVISEIFPNRMRGRAMSLAVLVIWVSCYLVSQTFPMLKEALGIGATFGFYGLCSLLGLIFVALLVPETKGRSLEEITRQWRGDAVVSPRR